MLINISQLTKKYRSRMVLDIPALSLKKGKIHGLQGPNGAGKTTLLNIFALLEIPTTGIVSYKSEPVQYSEPYLQRLRKEIVLVDQLPLLFTTTVFKNMEFGLKIRGIEKEARRRRIVKGLDMVGMRDFAQAQAHQLSGGETQRVALASRLVGAGAPAFRRRNPAGGAGFPVGFKAGSFAAGRTDRQCGHSQCPADQRSRFDGAPGMGHHFNHCQS
jgi:ABC-type methionine transport system ATPase subunit